METKFNFNSQACTSKIQSERLLSLGLKKETADIVHYFSQSLAQDWTIVPLADGETAKHIQGLEIPAWSLDRLKELYKCVGDTSLWNLDDVNYDRLIQCIGLAIKHNSFNKEYLV